MSSSGRTVYLAGGALHPFGRWPEHSLRALSSHAVAGAVADAGLPLERVEIAFFANAFGGLLTDQESVRGQVALHDAGLRGIPIVNVENACASGATALWSAIRAVRSGEFDVALAVGAEKMFVGDTRRTLAALRTAADVEATAGQGLQFVAIYAMRLQAFLDDGSLRPEHLARVTTKNRRNGALNLDAQFREPISDEQVMSARAVAGPLTLPMVSGISDGAAAVVVSAEPGEGPAVRVRASTLQSGGVDGLDDPAVGRAVQRAYDEAGIGPADLSVAEVHDTVGPAEFMRYVELGLCEPDEVGAFFDSGATSPGGRIPVNAGGGLTARGHPVGATGVAQAVELLQQLRGRAGARQVDGCRLALAQNSGGWLDGDTAVCSVHVFERTAA
jgi:acetyl-CoA acyltransferase